MTNTIKGNGAHRVTVATTPVTTTPTTATQPATPTKATTTTQPTTDNVFVVTPGTQPPLGAAVPPSSRKNIVDILAGNVAAAGQTVRELLPIAPTDPAGPNDVVFMHWSFENLFDPADDPATDDEEFSPNNGYGVKEAAIHAQNYANIIAQIAGGQGPDILTATEIENAHMADEMFQRLRHLGYQPPVHFESHDHRGIEQLVLTKYPVLAKAYHEVTLPSGGQTRGILQADLDVRGHTLSVFVVHLPSMRGGAQADVDRVAAATQLRTIIADLKKADPAREFVIQGDFNEDPDGPAQKKGLGVSVQHDDAVARAAPYNTLGDLKERKAILGDNDPAGDVQLGTHYFHPKNSWSTFDNMIVSSNMLDIDDPNGRGLAWIPGSSQVVVLPSIVTDMQSKVPDRFFDQNNRPNLHGESDHLPVTMRLRVLDQQRRPTNTPTTT